MEADIHALNTPPLTGGGVHLSLDKFFHFIHNINMTISYFYGTVDSQKSLLLYNQVVFSKKYKVPITVIYPYIFYMKHFIDFDKYNVCLYDGTCEHKEILFFPNEASKIKETNIYTIYHSHLFLLEEVKDLLQIIYKLNPFALVSFIGLKRDYTGEYFEIHNYLKRVANFTERLYAICSICGDEAEYNQAIMHGNEASYVPSESLLRLHYEPRCKDCFITPKEAVDE